MRDSMYKTSFLSTPCPALHRGVRKFVTPRASLCVHLYHLGRRSGKDRVYDDACTEFQKRMQGKLRVEEHWVNPQRLRNTINESARKMPVVLLDERGTMPQSSKHFADMLFEKLVKGGSRAAFVIGDADGIPSEALDMVKESHHVEAMSLGPLTFTHKMVRKRI